MGPRPNGRGWMFVYVAWLVPGGRGFNGAAT